MAAHEAPGKTNEHYTPWFIFDGLGERFDLDVAAPEGIETCVPAGRSYTSGALEAPWFGFVWMNPPYGHERMKAAWLNRFFGHGNGIALMPDRSSTEWHQNACRRADLHLNFYDKVKFWSADPDTGLLIRGNGPGCGSTLFAAGQRAVAALRRASAHGLGSLHTTLVVPPANRRITQVGNGHECWRAELLAARSFRAEGAGQPKEPTR